MARDDETIEPLLDENEEKAELVRNTTDPPAPVASEEDPEADKNNAESNLLKEPRPNSNNSKGIGLFVIGTVVLFGICALCLGGGILCTGVNSVYEESGRFFITLAALLFVKMVLCLRSCYLKLLERRIDVFCVGCIRAGLGGLDALISVCVAILLGVEMSWLVRNSGHYPVPNSDHANSTTIDDFFSNSTYFYVKLSDPRIERCSEFLFVASMFKQFVSLGFVVAFMIIVVLATMVYHFL